MTNMDNTANDPLPSSVHGDAETDLAARESARTGAREQGLAEGTMGTTTGAATGTTEGTIAPPATDERAMAAPAGDTAMTAPDTDTAMPAATNDATAAPATAAPGPAAGQGAMAPATTAGGGAGPLLSDPGEFTARWQSVQVIFVDEPRRAVEDADRLVREVMDRLTQVFSSQRDDLEKTWHAGGEASTEDLRLALQRYRSFFERLLAA
ncbi:MAG TPA: hypothetical protein VFA84_00750 [Acidimicrobiales bacterium]|nr:hypothetical protein [Acidimicrobiales bacterium]